MRTLAVVMMSATLAAGCAADGEQAAASGARQCFWASNVSSFAAADDRTVNLRVGTRDYYRLELMGPCPDVDWAQRIALESRGSNSICTGLDATIVAPSSIGPQRCPVRTVRRLSPDEVKALSGKAKP